MNQTQTVSSYPDVDAGGQSINTLHFTVRGYSENEIRPISVAAESLYDKIGNDTGLYSSLASGNYTLVIYHDKNEFLQKTKLPETIRAVSVGQTVYTYPGQDMEPALAHQLVHVIFNNFLSSQATNFRWLIEGIAMHEEVSRMQDSDRTAFFGSAATQLRANKMSFSQMTFFVPPSEDRRRTDVWYQQVESVVAFMLQGGNNLNFGNMMNALRSGAEIDHALNDAFGGRFRSMGELETAWRNTV